MVRARSHSKIRVSAKEERVRLLEAALQRNEKLALAGRITASVIHEINNPAEAIANLAYLISQNANNPEFVASLAGQIEQQLVRIQYASRQTLSFFREVPQRQYTDLVTLIETVIRFYEQSLADKQIEVRRRLPETLIASIYPGDFLQLVSNLLRNAIEAVSLKGILCIRLRISRHVIRLTISDNGCGIPSMLRSRLFEAFQTSKSEHGNGLGLWICKSVADRHGGHISWRSCTAEKKHGTTFSVLLAA
jgi:signal transduction histidine kinase